MNASTLTSERSEKRLSPHTPWPLVQPLPMRTPTPTSKPAATIAPGPTSTVAAGSGANSCQRPRRDQQPADEQQPHALCRQAASGQQRAQGCRNDAGDAGNAPIAQQIEGGGDTDQQASCQRGPGGEQVPVDGHSGCPFKVIFRNIDGQFRCADRWRATSPKKGYVFGAVSGGRCVIDLTHDKVCAPTEVSNEPCSFTRRYPCMHSETFSLRMPA